jgi:G3E family GTPase
VNADAGHILLNKTDLVSPEELAAIEAKIRLLNKFCEIHHATRAAGPLRSIS